MAERHRFTLNLDGTVTRASSSLDVNSAAFMSNGLIRFSSGQFQPYIGLGIGFYYAEVMNATFGPFTFGGENSHVDFAWRPLPARILSRTAEQPVHRIQVPELYGLPGEHGRGP